ncbi:hypothetical protein [Meiothermus sp.]|uniref:hypothetical protein n=1 Tax=Meiothermus sp. TaxID=1955249 RepID=UPI0021DDB2AC|nr:hypothetical protein [Meiothermus sp.]GIW26622.1 MAG: hypothetical protein KatS3mg069_2889 [Meiothermus sp.]
MRKTVGFSIFEGLARTGGWLVLGLLVLLLAACGGQGSGDTRTANVTVGTWNYGGQNVGIAMALWTDASEPTSPDGFTVNVTGPNNLSWSVGPYAYSVRGAIFFWRASSTLIPTSGSYTVSAALPGNPGFGRTLNVDATATLPQPQGVSLQATQNTATISWQAVSGAQSYFVEIWQLDNNNNPSSRRFTWYTTATQVQFTQAAQITLPPGNYRARVFAASVDFTTLYKTGQAAQLDPQVKLSSALSSAFQVQSTGALRLLDLPAPSVEPEAQGQGH